MRLTSIGMDFVGAYLYICMFKPDFIPTVTSEVLLAVLASSPFEKTQQTWLAVDARCKCSCTHLFVGDLPTHLSGMVTM